MFCFYSTFEKKKKIHQVSLLSSERIFYLFMKERMNMIVQLKNEKEQQIVTTVEFCRRLMAHIEDPSNELLYEIFGYLNDYEIYT